MFDDTQQRVPLWIWGVVLALVLILLSTRGRLPSGNSALEEHFAHQRTSVTLADLPQLDLNRLPVEVQQVAQQLQQQLGAGQAAPPLTPVAQSPRLRVEVRELRRAGSGVQIIGEVTNIGTTPITVPVRAFELRDSSGATYVADASGQAELAPGASTPLDLTVPAPPERGLLLRLVLPPDPPMEQVLLVAAR